MPALRHGAYLVRAGDDWRRADNARPEFDGAPA